MRISIAFLVLLAAVSINSCEIAVKESCYPDIKGKWIKFFADDCLVDSLDYMSFLNDSSFVSVAYFPIGHSDLRVYRTQGKYRFERNASCDSLFLITYDCEMNGQKAHGFKYLFLQDSTGFALVSHKPKFQKIDISWQWAIKNYFVGEKHYNAFLRSNSLIRTIIVLPKNLEDFPKIALGQPDGADEEFTSQGARVFRLSEKGLLSTKSAARPLEFARGDYKVVWDSINGEELKFISQLCLMRMKGLSDKEIIEMGFDLDAYYYHYPRYNPEARDTLNLKFGKVMKGQVKSLRVHNLRDYLLKNYPNREAVKE